LSTLAPAPQPAPGAPPLWPPAPFSPMLWSHTSLPRCHALISKSHLGPKAQVPPIPSKPSLEESLQLWMGAVQCLFDNVHCYRRDLLLRAEKAMSLKRRCDRERPCPGTTSSQ
ncbi:Hypothetical predicted protein, partial [Marmota monax]